MIVEQIGDCTLYCGDAFTILPTLPDASVQLICYEKAMYGRFAKSPTKYIPGAIILPSRGNGASRPDFFLEVNGLFSVAEFKANPFRYRDLYQLQEYMERFKATRGYAVAPSLICEAPENIIFVKMLPLWNTRAVTHELVASDIAQPTKEA